MRIPRLAIPIFAWLAATLLLSAAALGAVVATGNLAPGATSWSGEPIVASVANPSGATSVAEGFGSTAASYAQTFTVPIASSYVLERLCLYVGGGTGTSGAAPVTIHLYDLGGQSAPNPSGYVAATDRLGGGSGLTISYTTQPNGVLQLDFSGSDRVVLVAGRMYAFEIEGVAGTNPLSWLRGVTDAYTGGAAYRNRSWINGSNARDFALAVYGTATATPPTSSTINAAITHQVIDGFGAGTAFLDAGIQRLTDAQMDALYGTGANQMGLTLIRVRISPSGSGDWADPIANGQKAHLRGARILASPWTPPAAMKSNGSFVHGSLLPAHYQNYVGHLNSFTDTMAASGAPVSVISLQNEPDYDPDYEGCEWTAEQLRTFCRDFAGGLKVPVMMPEAFGFGHTVSDATLNDPQAAANVAYIGGHLYGATIRDYPLARSLGKPVWMTEYLENDQTIASAVATAQQVHDCLTIGNMSGYIWWKTLGNANGLLNATGELQRRAFVMGQFSRFIRPGDVRLDVPSNDSSLGISAFKDPNGGAFAIVAVNNTGAAIHHTFNLQGLTASAVTPWVTSATESLAEKAPVAITNGSFVYDVPATTVITFAGGPAARTARIVMAPQSQTVAAGTRAMLTAAVGGTPAPTLEWRWNGSPIALATNPVLTLTNVQPSNTGLYTMVATNPGGSVPSAAAILGVATVSKVIGAGRELLPVDIPHPNGNIFDQVLLTGSAESITADAGQVTRTSYIDLDDDIVQVEFSGPGTLSLVLDAATGPALPTRYNQAVEYMKGQAGIVITGANENTYLSVFTVGRATAVNQALFRDDVSYDGIADISFIAISTTNGRFGAIRTANTSFTATKGLTGLYAPGVAVQGPVFIGDISAFGSATPVIMLGSAGDARITGGDLYQDNGEAVQVSGLTRLSFTDGSDSHGHTLLAASNRAVLREAGRDVTAQIVNP